MWIILHKDKVISLKKLPYSLILVFACDCKLNDFSENPIQLYMRQFIFAHYVMIFIRPI